MKLGELFFDLGFHADTMKLKDFGKAIGDLNMTSILAVGNFGALYEGAKHLIDIAHDMGEGVNKFSMETGVSKDSLQRWQGVATDAGVSIDSVNQSLSIIRKTMDDIAHGQAPDARFNWIRGMILDMQHAKDASEPFMLMLKDLQSGSPDRARFLVNQLQFPPELLEIMKQIPDIQKNWNSQIILSDTELDDIQNNTKLMQTFTRDLNLLWAQLAKPILPEVNSALETINKTLREMQLSPDMQALLHFSAQVAKGIGGTLGLSWHGWEKIGQYSSALAKLTIPANSIAFSPTVGPLVTAQMLGSMQDRANSQNITQHNTIKIDGSLDPQAVAKAVDAQLGKHIDHAIATGSTGTW